MSAPTRTRRVAVGLLIALSLAVLPVGRPAHAQTSPLGGVTGDITEILEQLTKYVTGLGYLAGYAEILREIINFHQAHEPPHRAAVGMAIDALLHGMSCPVFVGDGTRLGEGSCVWTRVGGEKVASTSIAAATDTLDWHAGGQVAIAPGWFLGGTLGVRGSWMQTGLASGQARSVDAAVVVKHVDGPFFFSAGLGASSGTQEATRSGIGPGGGTLTMSSNSSSFSGGLRLRGAYQIAFERWYLRPRADLDVAFAGNSGLQESGPVAGLTIDPVRRWAVGVTPALEVGARFDVGSATIVRPYLSAGASVLPDNRSTISGTLGGVPFSGTAVGPPVVANIEAGLQLYQSKGWEMRLDYRLQAADSYLGQSLGLRAARHF